MASLLDIYGKHISLGIADQATFKTKVGGCFTVITVAIAVLCFLIFSADLVNHQNPSISAQNLQTPDATDLYIDQSNFLIVFAFDDGNFNINVTGFFELQIHYDSLNNYNETLVSTPIKYHDCTADDMNRYPGIYPQGHLLCMDLPFFSLNGSWTKKSISYLWLDVVRCTNRSNSSVICQPDDVITEKVPNTFFDLYMEDKSIDTNLFENPFSDYLKDQYWGLDNYLGKHVDYFIQKVNLETDSGFVLPSISNEYIYKGDTYEYDFFSNYDAVNRSYPLFRLELFNSPRIQKIQRIYPKVQIIAAEVAGVVRICSAIFFNILSFYTSYCLTIFLIRSEFDTSRRVFRKGATIGLSQQIEGNNKIDELSEVNRNVKNEPEMNYSESIEEKIQGSPNLRETNQFSNRNPFVQTPELINKYNEIKKHQSLMTRESEEGKNKDPSHNDLTQINFEDKKIKLTSQFIVKQGKEIIFTNKKFTNEQGNNKMQRIFTFKKSLSKDPNDIEKESGKLHELPMFNTKSKKENFSKNLKTNSLTSNYEKSSTIKSIIAAKFSQNCNNDESDLNISFYEYMKAKIFLTCCRKRKQKNKKLKLLHKAEKTISSYFDCRILIKKIMDINRMKKLILTDEQLELYEFLPKPKLFYDKAEKGTSLTIRDLRKSVHGTLTENKLLGKVRRIEEFKRRVLSQKNSTHIDRGLYNMLDPDLKESLEISRKNN